MAAAEVADRLTEIVLAGPAARVTPTAPLEFAGPEQLSLPEMVRRFQKHMGDRHLLVPVPLPGRAGRQMRAGGLLPQPGVEQGRSPSTNGYRISRPRAIASGADGSVVATGSSIRGSIRVSNFDEGVTVGVLSVSVERCFARALRRTSGAAASTQLPASCPGT